MRRFWNWIRNSEGQRELFFDGVIAEESWWGDEITPQIFKEELQAGSGPVLMHINSPGGDCFAASQIYTMLMDYKDDITVQIDGIAASAASVIAMAGTHIQMSPTAMMMIHDPSTFAAGNVEEMQKAIAILDEVKESIINAYELKTGLSRKELADLMTAETWMGAKKAKELGFCDEVLFTDDAQEGEAMFFSSKNSERVLVNRISEKLMPPVKQEPETKEPENKEPETVPNGIKAADLERRLRLLQ